MGPAIAAENCGGVASAHKAFLGPVHLLPKGEHVWSWFPAPATRRKAPVHREQEAALTILTPMAGTDQGINQKALLF